MAVLECLEDLNPGCSSACVLQDLAGKRCRSTGRRRKSSLTNLLLSLKNAWLAQHCLVRHLCNKCMWGRCRNILACVRAWICWGRQMQIWAKALQLKHFVVKWYEVLRPIKTPYEIQSKHALCLTFLDEYCSYIRRALALQLKSAGFAWGQFAAQKGNIKTQCCCSRLSSPLWHEEGCHAGLQAGTGQDRKKLCRLKMMPSFFTMFFSIDDFIDWYFVVCIENIGFPCARATWIMIIYSLWVLTLPACASPFHTFNLAFNCFLLGS